MRYFYVLLLLGLIISGACRLKLTKVNNLTEELNLYNHSDLLAWKNSTTTLTHFTASLLPAKKDPRVIGGRAIQIRERPFTAYLLLEYRGYWYFRGGAAIIARYWAITAAHCLVIIKKDDIKNNRAAICSNTSYWEEGYREHHITRMHAHEKYNSKEVDYDIALVRVRQPFNGQFEKPIKWAGDNYKYRAKAYAYVLGWGSINPCDFTTVRQLREAAIRLVDFNKCKRKYEEKELLLTNRMLCAGDKGKDACVFDSGGPLIQNGVLVGIVSWGSDLCGHKYLPGVYTKVSVFNQWIREKMGIKSRVTRKTNFDASRLKTSYKHKSVTIN